MSVLEHIIDHIRSNLINTCRSLLYVISFVGNSGARGNRESVRYLRCPFLRLGATALNAAGRPSTISVRPPGSGPKMHLVFSFSCPGGFLICPSRVNHTHCAIVVVQSRQGCSRRLLYVFRPKVYHHWCFPTSPQLLLGHRSKPDGGLSLSSLIGPRSAA